MLDGILNIEKDEVLDLGVGAERLELSLELFLLLISQLIGHEFTMHTLANCPEEVLQCEVLFEVVGGDFEFNQHIVDARGVVQHILEEILCEIRIEPALLLLNSHQRVHGGTGQRHQFKEDSAIFDIDHVALHIQVFSFVLLLPKCD